MITINSIPPDLVKYEIGKYLTPKDLQELSCTSKPFHVLLPSNDAIADLFFKNLGLSQDKLDLNGDLAVMKQLNRAPLQSDQLFSYRDLLNAYSEKRLLPFSSQIAQKVRDFLSNLRFQETGEVVVSFSSYPSVRIIGKSKSSIHCNLEKIRDLFLPSRTKKLHLICTEFFPSEETQTTPPLSKRRSLEITPYEVSVSSVEYSISGSRYESSTLDRTGYQTQQIESSSKLEYGIQFAQETPSISLNVYEKLINLSEETLRNSLEARQDQLAASAIKFDKIATLAIYTTLLLELAYLYTRLFPSSALNEAL